MWSPAAETWPLASHDRSDMRPGWERLERALSEALTVTGVQRRTFLGALTAEDPELASEVETLIGRVDSSASWFRGASVWLRPSHTPSPLEAESTLDPLVGTTVGGYRVQARLGGGGMGVVYRAQDSRLGRRVALKVLPPHLTASEQAKERLTAEARAVAALDHPNICTVYEIGEADDGSLFLVMAYYEGRTLREVLAQEGPLSPAVAADILAQVACALTFAHAAGIVHRDVKPANVMVTRGGIAKLLDFGVAFRQDPARPRWARPAGTVSYMAPEQLQGRPVDSRSDLWSLGVVLSEVLSGEKPFVGENTVELIDAIDFEAPDVDALGSIPDVGPLEALAIRLLAKDPDDRPADAGEVERALVRYVSFSDGASPGSGSGLWPRGTPGPD